MVLPLPGRRIDIRLSDERLGLSPAGAGGPRNELRPDHRRGRRLRFVQRRAQERRVPGPPEIGGEKDVRRLGHRDGPHRPGRRRSFVADSPDAAGRLPGVHGPHARPDRDRIGLLGAHGLRPDDRGSGPRFVRRGVLGHPPAETLYRPREHLSDESAVLPRRPGPFAPPPVRSLPRVQRRRHRFPPRPRAVHRDSRDDRRGVAGDQGFGVGGEHPHLLRRPGGKRNLVRLDGSRMAPDARTAARLARVRRGRDPPTAPAAREVRAVRTDALRPPRTPP